MNANLGGLFEISEIPLSPFPFSTEPTEVTSGSVSAIGSFHFIDGEFRVKLKDGTRSPDPCHHSEAISIIPYESSPFQFDRPGLAGT